MKQEMIWWQWHQLDHMQMICTSLQTDNHTSTSPLNILQAECSCWRPTNTVKYWYARDLPLRYLSAVRKVTFQQWSTLYERQSCQHGKQTPHRNQAFSFIFTSQEHHVVLSAANLTTLASHRDEMSREFFLHIPEPTLACITFSQIQEITQSYHGLWLTRIILECSLTPNVTAPLYSMR